MGKMAIYVSPGSEVLDVVTEEDCNISEIFVVDDTPIVASLEVTVSKDRIAEVERRMMQALSDDAEDAGEDADEL